jgi:four helix bundle protein
VALGSANELDYHLLLARDLGLVSDGDHERIAGEIRAVKRMLARLASSLSTDHR